MRIGEVARASGTTSKTLLYYEEVGPLPAADRTPACYRDYGAEVLDRLDFIRRGQAAGLTLAQLAHIAHALGRSPASFLVDSPTAALLLDRLGGDEELSRQVAYFLATLDDPLPEPP